MNNKCKNCGSFTTDLVIAPNGDSTPLCKECFWELGGEKKGFKLVLNVDLLNDMEEEAYAAVEDLEDEINQKLKRK